MQQTDPLLRTKLRPPFIRTGLVPRPRLQARISQGLRGPLTLIAAPAGFGKTTLAASCVAASGLPVAWLSLDKNDNQVGRFLSYLIAALQESGPVAGNEAAELLSAAKPAPAEAVLASLINDLDAANEERVLVLDDYQFVNSQAVHDAVAFLLEHCPNTLHMLVATRSDPPLPLARLRAHGQTVELRAADLRFTEPEAARFLNEVMGLHLDPRSIAALEERTEGWIAGLQMAALSMRDRKDVLGFIESFSGTNRYILDYLLEEVLAGQPPEIQRFLLYTSILERLTAPLCEAVLECSKSNQAGNDGSLLAARDSRATLEYLERANLFLVPLDDERIWYRYHHMFADLLGSQLLRTHPQVIPNLHRCASEWYEEHDWFYPAIEHAFSAGDFDRVARLIEGGAQQLVYQVAFETLQDWINRLPQDMVLQRVWLGITQGWLWVTKMQTGRLDSWLDQVEANFQAGETSRYSTTDRQDIRSNITALRAYDAFFKGDLLRCAGLSRQALDMLSPANGAMRVRILVQLGETYLALMDLEQASRYAHQAVEAAIALEEYHSLTVAAMRAYKALKILGKLNEAEELLRKVLSVLSHAGRADSPVATKPEQCWGDLMRERGHLDEAGVLLAQATEHARQYRSPLDIVTALIHQSMLSINQADLAQSQKVLGEAGALIQAYTIPPIVIASWSLQRARLSLERGEPVDVEMLLSNPLREEALIIQAKHLLHKGDFETAYQLLLQLEREAAAGQRNGNLIKVLILKAVALQALGDQALALEDLVRCLALAHPQSYLMTFIEEGEPVYQLLRQSLMPLHRRPLPQPLEGYVTRLLQSFEQRKKEKLSPQGTRQPDVTAAQQAAAPTGGSGKTGFLQDERALVEPLSSRELEVLGLLAQGKTNLEIARLLFIAAGTVKAHSASIYRKLDVANRTEAVARARQLGILP